MSRNSHLIVSAVALVCITALVTLSLARPLPVKAATKVRWEYAFFDGNDGPDPLASGLSTKTANKLGEQGWELVPMDWSGDNFLFRRQK